MNRLVPPYLYDYDVDGDIDLYLEKTGNLISDIIEKINTMIRKLVSDFNTVMKKHEINKTIKELENLPPELKVNSDVDLKKTADTYEDLMKGYQDVANNPDKKSNLNIVVVKAKEDRKKVILKKGAAIAVTVSTILGYLYLLQKKNDYKNYKIFEIKKDLVDSTSSTDKEIKSSLMKGLKSKQVASKTTSKSEYDSSITSMRSSKKEISDNIEKMNIMKKNAETSYANVRKMAKSILNNVKGTIKYGIKGIGVPKVDSSDIDKKYSDIANGGKARAYSYTMSRLDEPKFSETVNGIKKAVDSITPKKTDAEKERLREKFEHRKKLYELKNRKKK